jgi:hypothetical protein
MVGFVPAPYQGIYAASKRALEDLLRVAGSRSETIWHSGFHYGRVNY